MLQKLSAQQAGGRGGDVTISTTARLQAGQRDELAEFIAAVAAADGLAPLSEYKALRIGGAIDIREQVLLDTGGGVVGYGQAAWHGPGGGVAGHWALEAAILPAYRRPGAVIALVSALRNDLEGEMTLWCRQAYVGRAAETIGWRRDRSLWEMRRSLPIEELDTELPGFRIATFKTGADEAAWLEVNNAVFAGHPENGNMTRHDLEMRMAQPWFDPAGFFLVWEDGGLVGSCWTKMHDGGVGEIYIVGVTPGKEGRGIGTRLVAMGLDYLARRRQASQAMLYVESANDRAVRMYRRLGFAVIREVVAYRPGPNA
jgi:mycothiol synthase